MNSEDHCKGTAEKAWYAFTMDRQVATADSPCTEATLSGTLLQIRKSFRKRDINRAFVPATFLSPDKTRWSSSLIKTLLGRLSTLAETQERDLAKVEAECVCHREQQVCNPNKREEMSHEKVGGLPFILRNDPFGGLLFPGGVNCFPWCKRTQTRALLLSVYRGRKGFIWTPGIFSSDLNH